jgi:hypothetical protein
VAPDDPCGGGGGANGSHIGGMSSIVRPPGIESADRMGTATAKAGGEEKLTQSRESTMRRTSSIDVRGLVKQKRSTTSPAHDVGTTNAVPCSRMASLQRS